MFCNNINTRDNFQAEIANINLNHVPITVLTAYCLH